MQQETVNTTVNTNDYEHQTFQQKTGKKATEESWNEMRSSSIRKERQDRKEVIWEQK